MKVFLYLTIFFSFCILSTQVGKYTNKHTIYRDTPLFASHSAFAFADTLLQLMKFVMLLWTSRRIWSQWDCGVDTKLSMWWISVLHFLKLILKMANVYTIPTPNTPQERKEKKSSKSSSLFQFKRIGFMPSRRLLWFIIFIIIILNLMPFSLIFSNFLNYR